MGRPKGPTLTPADVIDAAVKLVRDEGAASLGVQNLARAMGIKAPSLYNHVAGLPELQRLVTIDGYRRLAASMTAAAKKHPERPLRAMAAAYRRFAKSEEGLYTIMSQTGIAPDDPEFRPVMLSVLAPLQAALAPAGLGEDAAIHAIRALRASLHGFALLEAAGGFGLRQDVDATFDWMITTHLRALGLTEP